ncbi:hypothetical protein BLOT_014439 [Blomia tropicalis]|nr:hypothetical protein BLOT_014439 [Blomia tropicalis]
MINLVAKPRKSRSVSVEPRSLITVENRTATGVTLPTSLNKSALQYLVIFLLVTTNSPNAPLPLACTTRSGIRSRSKRANSSRRLTSCNNIGPYLSTVNEFVTLPTGFASTVVISTSCNQLINYYKLELWSFKLNLPVEQLNVLDNLPIVNYKGQLFYSHHHRWRCICNHFILNYQAKNIRLDSLNVNKIGNKCNNFVSVSLFTFNNVLQCSTIFSFDTDLRESFTDCFGVLSIALIKTHAPYGDDNRYHFVSYMSTSSLAKLYQLGSLILHFVQTLIGSIDRSHYREILAHIQTTNDLIYFLRVNDNFLFTIGLFIHSFSLFRPKKKQQKPTKSHEVSKATFFDSGNDNMIQDAGFISQLPTEIKDRDRNQPNNKIQKKVDLVKSRFQELITEKNFVDLNECVCVNYPIWLWWIPKPCA